VSNSINSDELFPSPPSQEAPEGAPLEANTNPANISAPEDWRHLALRIENEKDPARVIELAQQLLSLIDQGKLAKKPDRVPNR
jgi:hypothetical protein